MGGAGSIHPESSAYRVKITDGAGKPKLLSGFSTTQRKENAMLYTIAVILLILWLLGLVTSYTVGGFIHILIVVAIVMVLIRLITGRSP
jgi:hypothetical protein